MVYSLVAPVGGSERLGEKVGEFGFGEFLRVWLQEMWGRFGVYIRRCMNTLFVEDELGDSRGMNQS